MRTPIIAALLAIVPISSAAAQQAPADPGTTPPPATPAAPTPVEAAAAGETGSGAQAMQDMAPEDAIRGLDPVDPSVYVDAFQTLVDPSGLTVNEVAQAAVETAPSVDRQEASIRGTQAVADRRWLDMMPQIEGSFGYTRLSRVPQPVIGGFEIPPDSITGVQQRIADQRAVGDPGLDASADVDEVYLTALQALGGNGFSFPQVLDQFAFRAGISYPVTDLFLTIMPAKSAAYGLVDVQRFQLEAERANIDLQAREAWYTHVRAQATMAVALAAQQQTEANRQQVEALVRAGVSPRVDLMRVEAQNAAARVGVARSQGAVLVSAHVVRTLMHTPNGGTGAIPVGENLAADLPTVTESREQLLNIAYENRAELMSLKRRIEAQDDLVSAQGGSRWPQIFVTANAEMSSPNQRVFPQTSDFNGSWAIGAVLQYRINQTFEGNEERNRSLSVLEQAEQDYLALKDAVTIEVDQAYETFRSSSVALQAAGAGLQAAEEAYRVRQEELAAGTAVARDLVDAESDLTRARIDLVDSIIDLRLAYAQLQRAINRLP